MDMRMVIIKKGNAYNRHNRITLAPLPDNLKVKKDEKQSDNKKKEEISLWDPWSAKVSLSRQKIQD